MSRKGPEPARRGSTAIENPSSIWVNEIELNSRALKDAARRAGLGGGSGSLRLSLESIERRRIQLFALTVGLLLLLLLSMTLVGGFWQLPLPEWLPKHYLLSFILVVSVLYGLYVFEQEKHLRALTRFLVDEQFHTDVVNRRLKLVETLLESAKAVNRDLAENAILDIVSRQVRQFFEQGDSCIYLVQNETRIKPISGNRQLGLDELARVVTRRNQSQFVRAARGDTMISAAVPIAARDSVLGALCLKTSGSGMDTFEVLMALSVFAEQAAAAIDNSRNRERARLDESRSEFAASHDSQTGLLTRERFITRLDKRLAEFGEDAPRLAVLFLNIDDLNRINNSLGYDVGDAVIRHYAETLYGHLPSEAIAGHFGGDEFLAALPEISGYEQAVDAASQLKSQLDQTLMVGNRKVWIASRIGVAMPETWQASARDLVRDAHIAMQEAKMRDVSVVRFDANLLGAADRALDLEEDLRRALDDDEIGIDLQPIIDLASMKPVAVEALVRWNHPEHGTLPATSFLPFAGQSGQQKQIDQRVFQKSCAVIRALRDRGFDIPVHANLFPGYLNAKDLIPGIERILDAAGIMPASFVIEVGDVNPLLDSEQVVRNLSHLKDMGFGICLDGFGSGTSGLAALNKTRIDSVKISRDFIASLGNRDDPHKEMVETIVALAERLELDVIAMGIENDHQLEILRELGCRFGQGNYLGKPQTLKAFIHRHIEGQESAVGGIRKTTGVG